MNLFTKKSFKILTSITLVFIFGSCNSTNSIDVKPGVSLPESGQVPDLVAKINSDGNSINVYRNGSERPILTQNAGPNFRPYIHPLISPDGNGIVTEYSPSHHKHQTGLYWGFKGIKEKQNLTEQQEQKYRSIKQDFSLQVKTLYKEVESGELSESDAKPKYEVLQKGRSGVFGVGKLAWSLVVYETVKIKESQIEEEVKELVRVPKQIERKDGVVIVKLSSEGVLLKVTSPQNNGNPTTDRQAFEALNRRGITTCNQDLVARVVAHAEHEYG